MKMKIRYEDALPVNAFLWTPRAQQETLHFHDSLEVGLCHQGSGTFVFSDKVYPIRPGDLFMVNNLELHIARSDPGTPCLFTFLNFDTSIPLVEDEKLLIPFAYQPQGFSNRIPAGSPGTEALARLVEEVYREMTEKGDGYRSAARGAVLMLCVQLLRLCASSVGTQVWTKATRNFRKKRELLEFLQLHYQYPVDLSDLATYLGTSESGASRAFSQIVGRPFRDHLHDLRVQDAKRRLLSTDASVTDICFASGFQSIPSFYRLFHHSTGMAPQDFRTRHPSGPIFQPGMEG